MVKHGLKILKYAWPFFNIMRNSQGYIYGDVHFFCLEDPNNDIYLEIFKNFQNIFKTHLVDCFWLVAQIL